MEDILIFGKDQRERDTQLTTDLENAIASSWGDT